MVTREHKTSPASRNSRTHYGRHAHQNRLRPSNVANVVAARCTGFAVAVRDMIYPRGCAGCDRPDDVLCARCRRLFTAHPQFPMPGTVMGVGYGAALYETQVRQAILLWKDHGDEECDSAFAEILAALAVDVIVPELCTQIEDINTEPLQRLLVVPAPSSPRSARSRGRYQMNALIGTVVRALEGSFNNVPNRPTVVAAPVLALRDVRKKSVESSSVRERSRRLVDRLSVRNLAQYCPEGTERSSGRTVAVLLDDIVTTGSTVRACVETLTSAGIPVLTALSLAYTPPQE